MKTEFTQREREIIREALSKMRDELSEDPWMVAELDTTGPSSLQESYKWDDYLTILSALEGYKPPQISADEMDEVMLLLLKFRKLALDIFRDQRIQPCPTKGCEGYLIFFSNAGKVPILNLIRKYIPVGVLDALTVSSSEAEAALGYIIAFCPWCHHIQTYDSPKR